MAHTWSRMGHTWSRMGHTWSRMGPYVVTSDDSYAQGMAVPLHGSIAPVRLEVPAAGAYRQVHCSLFTSLFTLYCNVLFCTVLYCTDVGNYLQIKSSNHNSHIGPTLLILAEKKHLGPNYLVVPIYKQEPFSY